MSFELETAANPTSLRRVVIEPVSRVEAHGKVSILLDSDDHVQQVRASAAPQHASNGMTNPGFEGSFITTDDKTSVGQG